MMMPWFVELLEYDIHFLPKGSIKSLLLTNFVVKLSCPLYMEVPHMRTFVVNNALNLKGSSAKVVFESPCNILIK